METRVFYADYERNCDGCGSTIAKFDLFSVTGTVGGGTGAPNSAPLLNAKRECVACRPVAVAPKTPKWMLAQMKAAS